MKSSPACAPVTAALLGAVLLLAGCGQKGPLYLPEKQVADPAATPAPAVDAPRSPPSPR